MTLEIRQIRLPDAASFNAAVGVVARERRYLYFTDTPPLAETEAVVRRAVEAGTPLLVLVHGDAVVGWCNIFPQPRPVQSHVGVVAMGIVPAWRDQGWGSRLMTAALAAADGYGYRRIELTVYASNPRARALYRKLGFVEEGCKRGSVSIDGTDLDEIMMARLRS
jgi:RimJ/RimL family protein N-acetyltransferase